MTLFFCGLSDQPHWASATTEQIDNALLENGWHKLSIPHEVLMTHPLADKHTDGWTKEDFAAFYKSREIWTTANDDWVDPWHPNIHIAVKLVSMLLDNTKMPLTTRWLVIGDSTTAFKLDGHDATEDAFVKFEEAVSITGHNVRLWSVSGSSFDYGKRGYFQTPRGTFTVYEGNFVNCVWLAHHEGIEFDAVLLIGGWNQKNASNIKELVSDLTHCCLASLA